MGFWMLSLSACTQACLLWTRQVVILSFILMHYQYFNAIYDLPIHLKNYTTTGKVLILREFAPLAATEIHFNQFTKKFKMKTFPFKHAVYYDRTSDLCIDAYVYVSVQFIMYGHNQPFHDPYLRKPDLQFSQFFKLEISSYFPPFFVLCEFHVIHPSLQRYWKMFKVRPLKGCDLVAGFNDYHWLYVLWA